jgi:type I restriction enzyme S subunit
LASAFEAAATGHGVTRLSSFATFENGDRGENYPNKSARVAQGIPFINAGHLAGQTIDMSAMDYIAEERFALLRSGKPINGDVLFCLRGSLGKFGVVEGIGPCAIASSLVIVRPKAGVSSRYIAAYFRSAMCADMIENQRSGTAQPNLGARQLANFTIPNMDTEGQNELVARVEAVAEECRQLRDLYEAKLAALAELKQSILARAFSGELTREPLAA